MVKFLLQAPVEEMPAPATENGEITFSSQGPNMPSGGFNF